MMKNEKKGKGLIDSPERLNRLVAGTKLSGDITTDSSLRLDGEIRGTIDCSGKFVLGTTGLLKGDLKSVEAEIEGSIEGDIQIQDLLILRKTAVITGTVETGRLIIEDGAQIGGTIATGNVKKPGKSASTDLRKEATITAPKEVNDVVY